MLIDASRFPHPRRGDLLAVPATGAYTLAMASNYNGVPSPAAVLVADGAARVVRARAARDRSPSLRNDDATVSRTSPASSLVSIAATMWGLDGLIRKPLSHTTTATTIVFGEHVVLVACTITLLVPALASLWRAGPATSLAGFLVGAGASAIATILFTQALFHGDFITVVVLQKVATAHRRRRRVARARRAAAAAASPGSSSRRSPGSGSSRSRTRSRRTRTD